jgi:hypothetical protein
MKKIDGNKWKKAFRNIAVDGACVLIFVAITYSAAQGFVTLYTAYWKTMQMPTPDVFQAAIYQFTAAIGLGYLLLQTKKHRIPDDPKKDGSTESAR